jgi:hypothetical protein
MGCNIDTLGFTYEKPGFGKCPLKICPWSASLEKKLTGFFHETGKNLILVL